MAVNVNFVLNLIFISPVYSKYLPSIFQRIVTWKLVIAIVQTKLQNQVLVVHVSCHLRVNFPTNQSSKTGNRSRFDRLK